MIHERILAHREREWREKDTYFPQTKEEKNENKAHGKKKQAKTKEKTTRKKNWMTKKIEVMKINTIQHRMFRPNWARILFYFFVWAKMLAKMFHASIKFNYCSFCGRHTEFKVTFTWLWYLSRGWALNELFLYSHISIFSCFFLFTFNSIPIFNLPWILLKYSPNA